MYMYKDFCTCDSLRGVRPPGEVEVVMFVDENCHEI